MKRFLILTLLGAFAFAQNTVSINHSETVYNTSYNGNNIDVIDFNAMSPGDTFCVTVQITNNDFTLAGFEFLVTFPPFLTLLSTDDADWQAEGATDAVFKIPSSGPLAAADMQKLPADSAGDANANQVNNNRGDARVGVLFKNAGERLAPSAGTTDLLELCFQYRPTPGSGAVCTSAVEAIRVFLTPNGATPGADIFANDSAARVAVVASSPQDVFGRAGIAVYVGDSTATTIRADWDASGVRDPADALGCISCAFFGLADPSCSGGAGANLATLDLDCNNAVDAADALGLLNLTFGLGNRPAKRALDFYGDLDQNGTLVVNSEETKASMSKVSLAFEGIRFGEPTIDEAAKKAGWMIVSERANGQLDYMVINPSKTMMATPKVYISYENPGNGKFALMETMYQKRDYSFFNYAPVVEDHAANTRQRENRETIRR